MEGNKKQWNIASNQRKSHRKLKRLYCFLEEMAFCTLLGTHQWQMKEKQDMGNSTLFRSFSNYQRERLVAQSYPNMFRATWKQVTGKSVHAYSKVSLDVFNGAYSLVKVQMVATVNVDFPSFYHYINSILATSPCLTLQQMPKSNNCLC